MALNAKTPRVEKVVATSVRQLQQVQEEPHKVKFTEEREGIPKRVLNIGNGSSFCHNGTN